MKVVLAGASGFLGQALARDLITHGHRLVQLVRRDPVGPTEIRWRPERGQLDPATIAGADAVIGLSGAGIEDRRWNSAYKQVLRDSRVRPTATIATTIAGLPAAERPRVLISASAVGFYGERDDDELTEQSSRGRGYLADLVGDWEGATRAATEAGVRVVTVRTGLVLARSGGLLKRLSLLYQVGLGGKLGNGRQYQSWISLADEIEAIRFALEHDTLAGPVNLTAPQPVRNAEFSAALGAVLHRPAVLTVPRFALRLALGEFADEGVLVSQRVLPVALTEAGFQFQHRDVRAGLEWAIRH